MSKINFMKPDKENLNTFLYLGSALFFIGFLDVFLNAFFASNITGFLPTTLSFLFPLIIGFIGLYFIRIENNDGNAVRSSTALLTVSDAPAWVTAAGSLGSFDGNTAISTITLTATDATSFAVTSGTLTAGLTLTSGSGSATITGTQTAHTSATTDNFTVTATDAEGQTAARAFSISYTFGATGSGGFN